MAKQQACCLLQKKCCLKRHTAPSISQEMGSPEDCLC